MHEFSSDSTLFTRRYKDSLREMYPCYGGLCWAVQILEEKKQTSQEWKDARDTFTDLYALAVKELGEEAMKQFVKSIQSAEDRSSMHGRMRKPFPEFREKAFFCKLEIKKLEKIYQELSK